jgi:hypothetical protein
MTPASTLTLIFPADHVDDGLDAVRRRAGVTRRPFSSEVIDFLDGLSRDLFSMVRSEPALAPLAFFVRRANLRSLAASAEMRTPAGTILVPQGTVFHVPPTNVDTLFLYTLAISLLAGNANLVRISRNAGPATFRIVDLLVRRLSEHPEVADLVTIVSFDRDPDVLAALSLASDMRMVWGGDAAISAIRSAPLQPHAKELTFPDRISLAAISVPNWRASSEAERRTVVDGLYNDTFWFDQMACSSPVHVVLVGGSEQDAEAVRAELSRDLAAVAGTRYDEVDGQAINKMVDVLRGFDRGMGGLDWVSNSVVTINGATMADAAAIRPGGGFFSTQHVAELADVRQQVVRRIQTLSVFGFASEELIDFAKLVNGSGIDRIVPIGHALDFAAVWDGKDLLMESLRFVTVEH